MKLPRACVSIPTVSRLRHAGGAMRIDWSRDGRYLATVSFDKRMGLWDASTGALVHFFGISDCFVEAVAFSPDSTMLASGKKSVSVFDLATKKKALTLKGHRDTVHDIHFSPDGTRIATASSDGTVRLWDLTGAEVARFDGAKATAVRYSPDGKSLLIGRNGTLTLCSAVDGAVRASTRIGGWDGKVRADFLPDGSVAVAGHDQRAVQLLAAETLEEIGRGEVDHWLRSAAASPCGRWVAYCGGGRYAKDHPHQIPHRTIHSPHVYIWDVQKGALHRRLTGHVELMQDVTFSPDGSRVASSSSDNTVRVWSLPDGEPLLVPAPGFEEDITHLTWRSSTELIVSGRTDAHRFSADGTHLGSLSTRRWSIPLPGDRVLGLGWRGSQVISLADPGAEPLPLAETGSGEKGGLNLGCLLPDGTVLATGSSSIRRWSLQTGAVVGRFKARCKPTSLAVSPDGSTLAAAGINDNGRIWLHALPDGTPTLLATLQGERVSATVLELVWTSDGSALLAATNDGRVWRVPREGKPTIFADNLTRKRSWGYSGTATLNLSLSPNGRWLAASFPFSGDTFFLILSAADGRVVKKVTGHKRPVHGLAFSPDGKLLASMDVDFRQVMVWDVAKWKLK